MNRIVKSFVFFSMSLISVACFAQNAENGKQLGGVKPKEAFEYMKTTDNLVIVDVREPQYINNYFEGSIRIPWTQMEKRYNEIPKGRPVILNCGLGQVAPRAYQVLTEKRKDIPELSYIAGAPLFSEYNKWLREKKK